MAQAKSKEVLTILKVRSLAIVTKLCLGKLNLCNLEHCYEFDLITAQAKSKEVLTILKVRLLAIMMA